MHRLTTLICRLLAAVAASAMLLFVAVGQAAAMVPSPGTGGGPKLPVSHPSVLTSPWLIVAVLAIVGLVIMVGLSLRSQHASGRQPHPAG